MNMSRLRRAAALLAAGVIQFLGVHAGAATPLKYQFKGQNEVYYQVTIKADLPDAVETHTGTIVYQIKSVDPANGQVRFGYTSQMRQQRELKTTGDQRFRGMPMIPPMPFPFGPGQAAPDIMISPQGTVLRSNRTDDASQLPHMLGYAWQLMLPVLSADGSPTWKEERALAMSVRNANRGWPGGPPWAMGSENRTDHPGHETVTYSLGEANGAIAPITRQYELATDEKQGTIPLFHQSGQGKIQFDTATGMVQAMEMNYTLEAVDNNVAVKVPVTVSARLLTAEEVAKYKAEREKEKAKLKAIAARHRAQREAEKAVESGTTRTPEIGNGHGSPFVRADVKLRSMTGLRISTGDWMGRKCIKKLEPLYEQPADATTEENTTDLMAKPGYAIGGLVFNTAKAPKKDLYGMQVIFMRLDKDNPNKLVTSDQYRSAWFADTDKTTPKIALGGKGDVVLGIFGREAFGTDSIGLILKDPNAAGNALKDGEKAPDEVNADSLPKEQ